MTMKNPLNKRIPRDFRTNWSKYTGMFLILVLTIMIGSSFSATVESTIIALDRCETENRLEDGFFETSQQLSEAAFSKLESLDISLAPIFYYRVNDFDDNAKLLVFDERTELDIPCVFEGRLPENENEIAFDRICAREHGLEIGSTVELSGRSFTLCGLVALPDYSSLFANNSDLVMNTTDFGVSVVSHEGFKRYGIDCVTYRYAYRLDDAASSEASSDALAKSSRPDKKAQKDKAEAIIRALYAEGIMPSEFLTAEANQSITFLKLDMGKDGPMMEMFVYILVAVIAFIFAVLTNNTIDSEAPIIGTLRSLGFTKREIIRHYLTPVIFIALSASLIGNALGYTVMLSPMYSLYYTTYSVPRIETVFSVSAFIKTTVIPIILMPLINIIMLRSRLSLSPLKFLRHDLKKNGKQKTVRLTRGSFLTRFRIRVILQNKGSYVMLFFGIIISTLLLLFGIGIGPMFDNYVDSIADSTPFENQYLLKAEYDISTSETGVGSRYDKIEISELDTYYSLAGKDIGITMMGIGENSIFFKDIKLPAENNKGVISSAMAEKLGLKVGDRITLSHPYNKEKYGLEICGVYDFMSSVCIFMKQENLNEMLGNTPGAFNAYLSDEKLDIPEQYLAKLITKKDLCGAATQMLKSFDSIIKMINIFSVAIYMILMFILTKAIIEKNALSISYLKVFGYESREINKVFLRATAITVILSLLVALPIDFLLIKVLMLYITALIEGYVSFYVPLWVFGAIIGICIAAYYLVNALHVRHIRKIPMQEALKCRE